MITLQLLLLSPGQRGGKIADLVTSVTGLLVIGAQRTDCIELL